MNLCNRMQQAELKTPTVAPDIYKIRSIENP